MLHGLLFLAISGDSPNISRQHSVSYELVLEILVAAHLAQQQPNKTNRTQWWWKRPNVWKFSQRAQDSWKFGKFLFLLFPVLFEVMEEGKFTFFHKITSSSSLSRIKQRKVIFLSNNISGQQTQMDGQWQHTKKKEEVYRFNFDLVRLTWLTFP